MGVGKGTFAREYAKHSGIYNIDTDDLIESAHNMRIKSIFKKKGEPHFRGLEQECANWIENSINHTIISCGGGFYKVKNLKSLGTVVLLDASYEWIYKRLKSAPNAKKKIAKRPLFKRQHEAKKLYNLRKKEYSKVADIILDMEKGDTKEIIKTLDRKLNSLRHS
ncbi:MAG: shikimate kinase [Campylobacterales bacterium]|nr:shikimate kinase [Campylobacterales bacterium]